MSANKRITEEQFTDGSTIDGTRIDKAYDDTYRKLNNISKADLKQIWVPRTIYSGWQTAHFDEAEQVADEVAPMSLFYPLYNSFTRDIQGATGARTKVNNEWRWKGTQIYNRNFVAQPAGSSLIPDWTESDVVGRTWSFYFEKPCVITDISIIWEVDNFTGLYEEPNAFGPPNGAPTNIERNRETKYWWGQAFVDSVNFPEDKRKGSPVWRRTERSDFGEFDSFPRSDKKGRMLPPHLGLGAGVLDFSWDRSVQRPFNDFRPNDYQNQISSPATAAQSIHPLYQGWWDKNLNIPIPQESRFHLGMGCAIEFAGTGNLLAFCDSENYHRGYRFNIVIGIMETIEE